MDPENPAPGVRLARFHQATNNQSAYNEQLTALVKRFPEAKAVLLLSAEESVRRKSWLKALKTLRQARTADPADGSVISLMLKVLHRFDKGAGSLIGDNGLPWTEACNEQTINLGPAARKQGSSYQIRIAACTCRTGGIHRRSR